MKWSVAIHILFVDLAAFRYEKYPDVHMTTLQGAVQRRSSSLNFK